MRKTILSLALLFTGAAAFAEADCSKTADACAAGKKNTSPFVQASLRESVPPHIENAARKTGSPALSASTAPSSLPAGVPAESGGRLSSPAWLLLVIAGFAGLYFYLREGAKKRKRK